MVNIQVLMSSGILNPALLGCTAVIPRGQAIKFIDIVPQHTFRAYANFPDAQQSEITEPWRTQRNPDTS